MTWRGLAVVGAVAGIGFTMALFIASLAFTERQELRDIATVAILCSSAISVVLAWLLGHVLLSKRGTEMRR